jgi:hypothetical protein
VKNLRSSGAGGGDAHIVTFLEAPPWTFLTPVVRWVCGGHVGLLYGLGVGCQGGGPERWATPLGGGLGMHGDHGLTMV